MLKSEFTTHAFAVLYIAAAKDAVLFSNVEFLTSKLPSLYMFPLFAVLVVPVLFIMLIFSSSKFPLFVIAEFVSDSKFFSVKLKKFTLISFSIVKTVILLFGINITSSLFFPIIEIFLVILTESISYVPSETYILESEGIFCKFSLFIVL